MHYPSRGRSEHSMGSLGHLAPRVQEGAWDPMRCPLSPRIAEVGPWTAHPQNEIELHGLAGASFSWGASEACAAFGPRPAWGWRCSAVTAASRITDTDISV